MPFYQSDSAAPKHGLLRDFLDATRESRYKGAYILGIIDQMTNQQVADEFGFADATVAGNAKAELQSDIGKLLTSDGGVTTAQQQTAVNQMLAQFG